MSIATTAALNLALSRTHDGLRRSTGLKALLRMALAAYDHRDNMLRSVASSGLSGCSLDELAVGLHEVPSLAILASATAPRVIADLTGNGRPSGFTLELVKMGVRSSATFPLWNGNLFVGFLFLDAAEPNYFRPATLAHLGGLARAFAHMLPRKIGLPA